MSYDLEIWSTAEPRLPDQLPDPPRWEGAGGSWLRKGRGWQLSLYPPDRVLIEDVPEPVAEALPGIAYLVRLHLHPMDSPPPGRRLQERTARMLAKACHGVVFDPQEDSIRAPRVKRYTRLAPANAAEPINLLCFKWLFNMGPLHTDAGLDAMADCFSRFLPEALPRRYGLYEPPQHLYAETGLEHFKDFVRREARRPGGFVWYPHKPLETVHLGIHLAPGPTRHGFRSQYLEVTLLKSVLRQPGWPLGLRTFWMEMSNLIQPFYGDVRTLRDARDKPPWSEPPEARHPICGWFWAGVPAADCHAAVLGPPYVELWPAFSHVGERSGNLVTISDSDWAAGPAAFASVGGVPADIAQQSPGYAPEGGPNDARPYPPVWPFGQTHDPSRLY